MRFQISNYKWYWVFENGLNHSIKGKKYGFKLLADFRARPFSDLKMAGQEHLILDGAVQKD